MRRPRRWIWLPAAALALSACNREDRDLPDRYRTLEVPAARLASGEARQRGRALYLENCAFCHGENADGKGERDEALSGPPANFTDPDWQRRMSPRRVYWRIREGVPQTSMPAWKGTLSEEETWDLVGWLKGLGAPHLGPAAGR